MTNILLIDFGASRVKSAIADIDTGVFSNVNSYPSLPNCSKNTKEFELPLMALKDQFLSICNYYKKLEISFKSIMLCSQMHGFILLDGKNNAITNYTSWKDERSLTPINGEDTFSLLKNRLGDKFKSITGMKPRPGLPIMNIVHLARMSKIAGRCKVVSLPEWLSMCSDNSNYLVHDTMLAGSGFYDIKKGNVSQELLSVVREIANIECEFNTISSSIAIAGYWHDEGSRVPIYVGVGDHQCAVLGACNRPKQTISLNIGTGSQVSIIDSDIYSDFIELRPYFNSQTLSAITHIPAGRVISEYIDFLKDINNECDYWDMLRKIKKEDILNATLNFDLGLFNSAWGYKSGGEITNIREGGLTLKNYLASLIRSFLKQYVDVMDIIDPEDTIKVCMISGGIARRLPEIVGVVSAMTGRRVMPPPDIDETFLGLRSLSLINEQRAVSYFDAQSFFEKKHLLHKR